MELTIKNTVTGYEIPVPKDCNVTVDEDVVIFEPKDGESEPEFEEYDFVFDSYFEPIGNSLAICGGDKNSVICQYFLNSANLYYELSKTSSKFERKMTPAEKQILLDALAKEGKAWDADKKQIVDLAYIPKVGDCVRGVVKKGKRIIAKDVIGQFTLPAKNGVMQMNWCINEDGVLLDKTTITINFYDFTKITPDELQAEFNKIGYEYDFTTHTAKKIEWKPKVGEKYWYINIIDKEVESDIYSQFDADTSCLKNLDMFKTEQLAQSAYDKVNELLKELPKE